MKYVYRSFSWLVAAILAVVIVLTVVRLVINPWYLTFEYHTPGFPADPYGFTLQDRLNYGKFSVDYLVNSADISFLSDLRFPAGQQAPQPSCQFMTDCTHFYNDRELEHMMDVKNVVRGAIRVLEISVLLLVLLALWAWRGNWAETYLKGLQRGGMLTLLFIGLIILSVFVAFNYIFIIFHEIFFKAGTWTFLYSDTLIRQFPERFWQDTFLMVGGLSAALALVFYFVFRRVLRKRQS
ncbi:MAG: TIGR01906 family membrane protein [Anaerolineales bacterium]|jgi:integral membrane protein (TIGR01906 family)